MSNVFGIIAIFNLTAVGLIFMFYAKREIKIMQAFDELKALIPMVIAAMQAKDAEIATLKANAVDPAEVQAMVDQLKALVPVAPPA